MTQPAVKSVDTSVTTVCSYRPVGVPYSKQVHVDVVVPDEEPSLDSFRGFRSASHDQQPIDVGAASAFWDDGTVTLSLWQHGHEVDILVSNSWYGWSHAQSKAVATQLAKTALSRL